MKQLKEKEYEEFQQYLYNKLHGYIWTPYTLELICSGNDYDPEKIGKQMLEMKVKIQNEHISHMLSDKRKKYVIRSLRKIDEITYKAMMGEYIIYYKGKIVGGVFDDGIFPRVCECYGEHTVNRRQSSDEERLDSFKAVHQYRGCA